MRLWSLHPQYLDVMGFIALWREGLLAQKVLEGKTLGYRNHPQLDRFKLTSDPRRAIGYYLNVILKESLRRQYAFNGKLILHPDTKSPRLPVPAGQLAYEFEFLREKLKKRSPEGYVDLGNVERVLPHPAFKIVEGSIASWERGGIKVK